jgi:DNA-binding IclR family transcriptional regulator
VTPTAPSPAAPRRRGRRPAQGEPVVDRALSLLAAFDAEHRSLSVGELSRRTGIPKSSANRLARHLQAWGALERDTDGRYVIGLRLWQTGALAPRGHGLQQIAMPYLGDLAQATRQHVLLAVRDGDHALLVERLSAHRSAEILYAVGGRLPLHSTGVGLVLLAYAGAEFQEAYLSRPLVHEPERQPVSPSALRRTLAEVRRDGLATVHRSAYAVVSVAAPVFGADDQVAAALSVVVPERGAEPHMLGLAVRTAARSISRGLGAHRSIGLTTIFTDP